MSPTGRLIWYYEYVELLNNGRLKETMHIFFFDCASNVQKAEEILSAHAPRAHVLQGAELVIALLFKDPAKHPVIKVKVACDAFYCLHVDSSNYFCTLRQKMVLKECWLYNVYGSGGSHGIYALFQAHVALHNNRKYFRLLRSCLIRMASWFITME